MRRRTRAERIDRLRERDRRALCEPVRRKCIRWAADHREALAEATPALPEALTDRQQDNWAPLVAIADETGGTWPVAARQASLILSGVRPDQDDQIGVELLADIKTVSNEEGEDALSSEEILKALIEMEDRPWATWGKAENPITPHALPKLLKPFGIVPAGDMHFGGKVCKGYRRAAFEDDWVRYLDVEPLQGNNANNDGPELAMSNRYTEGHVAVTKSGDSPITTGICSRVAVEPPREGLPGVLTMPTQVEDVLIDPAVGALCALEDAGLDLAVVNNRLRVWPTELLTPERERAIRQYRVEFLVLVRVCDEGVQARRDAFVRLLETAPAGVVVPVLLFREGVPYERGVCFSCGDALEAGRFSRCWRCGVAAGAAAAD